MEKIILKEKEIKLVFEELVDASIEFAKEVYDIDIPRENFTLDGRIGNSIARYYSDSRTIMINKQNIKFGATINALTPSILHEVVHHCLYVQGYEYEDGTETFEQELQTHKLGTNPNFANLEGAETESLFFVYKPSKGCYIIECGGCNKHYRCQGKWEYGLKNAQCDNCGHHGFTVVDKLWTIRNYVRYK